MTARSLCSQLLWLWPWLFVSMLSLDAKAKSQKNSLEIASAELKVTFPAGSTRARDFAEPLSLVCNQKNLENYLDRLRKTPFWNEKNQRDIEVRFTTKGLRVPAADFELELIGRESLTARIGARKFAAKDLCELLVTYLDRPKVTAFDVMISRAHAQTRVDENASIDAVLVGASAGFAAVGLFPPFTPLGVAFLGLNAYGAYSSWNSLSVKRTFEGFLNDSFFKVKCDASSVVLSNGPDLHQIVVRKIGNGIAVDFVTGDKVVIPESKSVYAENSRKYLTQLAKNCNNSEDAKRLQTEIATERYHAIEKARFLGKYAASETTAPAKANSPARP